MAPFPGLQPQTLLQSVLDNVGVALAVIDREHRFVFTNQAALDIFGATENLSLDEWGRDYKFEDSLGRQIPRSRSPLLRAFCGEQVEPYDVRVTLPDGRIKWLHVAAHSFSILGLTGVFVIVADETEQVLLRRAMERAQRIEEFGILAGGLAHDFNNILSVLSANVFLALSDEGVPETTRACLQQMDAALKSGAAQVSRLMGYSRTQEMRVRSVQINEVVNGALKLAHPVLKNRVRVKAEMSDSLPAVQADFSRLEQVLVNLILNAVDAMPEGGELTLGTKLVSSHGVHRRKHAGKEPFVLITVADTGIGIPEKHRPSIFDPFFTTKPGSKGAGLGLSSAQAIVRQHKGHIEVQSAPGAGTKFSIYLPVGEGSATSPEL
jgi:two-component system, cell cycle sensor histidine kinase and response regulator CckA